MERPKITDDEIVNWFTYHSPRTDQQIAYVAIRDHGKKLAYVIRDCCPASADATAAIRKVREAVMTANAAVACAKEE